MALLQLAAGYSAVVAAFLLLWLCCAWLSAWLRHAAVCMHPKGGKGSEGVLSDSLASRVPCYSLCPCMSK